MEKFYTFPNLQDARDYRHINGTGGYIFEPENNNDPVILFPPDYPPSKIFYHHFTRGKSGRLICN
jgi:hypothetical protein